MRLSNSQIAHFGDLLDDIPYKCALRLLSVGLEDTAAQPQAAQLIDDPLDRTGIRSALAGHASAGYHFARLDLHHQQCPKLFLALVGNESVVDGYLRQCHLHLTVIGINGPMGRIRGSASNALGAPWTHWEVRDAMIGPLGPRGLTRIRCCSNNWGFNRGFSVPGQCVMPFCPVACCAGLIRHVRHLPHPGPHARGSPPRQ